MNLEVLDKKQDATVPKLSVIFDSTSIQNSVSC